ncbi:dUTP diphosphatase [Paenibacillus apii]|uniref:dUTP diphosphatase n=1 Tax=Paenibacillus apii TaxID=1850370 RepID=UPI00143A5859|nr:dUTP diphosphatase [Paenibacillus apii]NJJ38574.1 dUTPase [Paenibacillus apii]
MNLSKLFEMQKELDDYIVKTKGLEGQDLLPQKILALQVELAECANEWRGFKYWSEDKEARTKKHKTIPTPDGYASEVINPLLEEYVDCLHFVLSIGLEIGVPTDHPYSYDNVFEGETPVDLFQYCFNDIAMYVKDGMTFNDCFHFLQLIRDFISLGLILGFIWDEIETAYHTKWEINKQRQVSGY